MENITPLENILSGLNNGHVMFIQLVVLWLASQI